MRLEAKSIPVYFVICNLQIVTLLLNRSIKKEGFSEKSLIIGRYVFN